MSDKTPPIKRKQEVTSNEQNKKKKVSFDNSVKTFDGMRKESLSICTTIKQFIMFKNYHTNKEHGEIINADSYVNTLEQTIDIWKYIDKVYFIISVLNSGKKYGFLPSQEAINPKKDTHKICKNRLYIFLTYLIFKAFENDVIQTKDFFDKNEMSHFKSILDEKLGYEKINV